MRTLLEASRALEERRISPVELTQLALERIHALNPRLNCFLAVHEDSALNAARALQKQPRRGPLHGIPIAHKDLFCTAGIRTTAGSRIFADYAPDYDAAVVEKLAAAGAISLGKLNLHELAYGITSQNAHFGGVRNPWNLDCIPGGSSGGSASAVAAGLVYCGTGTDTGGSIRIPASYCGVFGIKPTFGRVSRFGCLPLSDWLDHAGPLTPTARDSALILNAIQGYDSRDPDSAMVPPENFLPPDQPSLRGLSIGVPRNFYFDRVEADAAAAVDGMIQLAGRLGARLVEVDIPDVAALNQAAITMQLAQVAYTHRRIYDRLDEVGPAVRPLLERGRTISTSDYLAAEQQSARLRQQYESVWDACDLVFTPSTPIAAPRIDALPIEWRDGGEPEDIRLCTTRLIRAVNALRYPASSQPCGFSREGLPYGLQIIGPMWSEARILLAAAALEDATDFHLRTPSGIS
jgi:aspartyl-tRNA(Asn)/glutamyl-tRNA(Gln) amidotransferase subunit A